MGISYITELTYYENLRGLRSLTATQLEGVDIQGSPEGAAYTDYCPAEHGVFCDPPMLNNGKGEKRLRCVLNTLKVLNPKPSSRIDNLTPTHHEPTTLLLTSPELYQQRTCHGTPKWWGSCMAVSGGQVNPKTKVLYIPIYRDSRYLEGP